MCAADVFLWFKANCETNSRTYMSPSPCSRFFRRSDLSLVCLSRIYRPILLQYARLLVSNHRQARNNSSESVASTGANKISSFRESVSIEYPQSCSQNSWHRAHDDQIGKMGRVTECDSIRYGVTVRSLNRPNTKMHQNFSVFGPRSNGFLLFKDIAEVHNYVVTGRRSQLETAQVRHFPEYFFKRQRRWECILTVYFTNLFAEVFRIFCNALVEQSCNEVLEAMIGLWQTATFKSSLASQNTGISPALLVFCLEAVEED